MCCFSFEPSIVQSRRMTLKIWVAATIMLMATNERGMDRKNNKAMPKADTNLIAMWGWVNVGDVDVPEFAWPSWSGNLAPIMPWIWTRKPDSKVPMMDPATMYSHLVSSVAMLESNTPSRIPVAPTSPMQVPLRYLAMKLPLKETVQFSIEWLDCLTEQVEDAKCCEW